MSRLDRTDRVPFVTPEEFYNKVAETDSRPVPEFLTEARTYGGGSFEVPVERFLSREYHQHEVERLWKRVWQMACREEEIPEVGDVYVYDIATLQFLIVRVAPDRIKAYPNSCMHRGRKIVDCNKRVSELRCPFHGFTWDLEGRISTIPSAWDFDHIEEAEDWRLPEAKVGVWGGFVFINPDPDAEPLADFLGDIDRHYERYSLPDRYISAHARKIVPCNWKVAQEAFLETLHISATHPQIMPQGAHSDNKYDVYGNFSRTLGSYYIPHAAIGIELTNQQILNSMADVRLDEEPTVLAKEGYSVRQQMAEMARAGFEKTTGQSADHFSDSELIDVCFMSVFPNFAPWTLFNRICYLFRPYKDDPNRAIMDVYQLAPFNKSEARPAPATLQALGEDEDWTAAKDISVYLARIANQDAFNFGPLQDGLKSSATGVVRYSNYQESRIRHFHDLLTEWVEP